MEDSDGAEVTQERFKQQVFGEISWELTSLAYRKID